MLLLLFISCLRHIHIFRRQSVTELNSGPNTTFLSTDWKKCNSCIILNHVKTFLTNLYKNSSNEWNTEGTIYNTTSINRSELSLAAIWTIKCSLHNCYNNWNTSAFVQIAPVWLKKSNVLFDLTTRVYTFLNHIKQCS